MKAFYNCSGLKTLEIMTSKIGDVSAVGKKAFSGTPKKMKIKIHASKRVYENIKDTLIERGVNRKASFKLVN